MFSHLQSGEERERTGSERAASEDAAQGTRAASTRDKHRQLTMIKLRDALVAETTVLGRRMHVLDAVRTPIDRLCILRVRSRVTPPLLALLFALILQREAVYGGSWPAEMPRWLPCRDTLLPRVCDELIERLAAHHEVAAYDHRQQYCPVGSCQHSAMYRARQTR